MSTTPPALLFTDFCVLLSQLRQIPPISIEQRKSLLPASTLPKETRVLISWITKLRTAFPVLPPATGVQFFRLLFPEEGMRRRYGMQETLLAACLEPLFGLKRGYFAGWSDHGNAQRCESAGSLGVAVERALLQKGTSGKASTMTLSRCDNLLDQLAAHSTFSAKSVSRTIIRSRSLILADLFSGLSAENAGFLVQIILQDLPSMLYPPIASGSRALRDFNSVAYAQIDLYTAMNAWDVRMSSLHRIQADLDVVARLCEKEHLDDSCFQPALGTPVRVPKTERYPAVRKLRSLVAVETKYDGERLQIHINMDLPRPLQIQIFSKSTRDSTLDRARLIPILRATLGLDFLAAEVKDDAQLAERLPTKTTSIRTGIFEGEMMVYNERERADDLFYKLQSVKDGRAPMDTQSSIRSAESTDEVGLQPRPNLHLKVVFFDALMINGTSLLNETYDSRRNHLEQSVAPIHGYSALTAKTVINFDDERALDQLRQRFAEVITDRGEGLILKPCDSMNNDTRQGRRWIKLKKDFIPGCGDTLDFVILGGSWNKARGHELLVPPSVLTTFYVGLRADELGPNNSTKPHYQILFSTSYGLDRAQLEDLNFSIRSSTATPFDSSSCYNAGGRGHLAIYEPVASTFTFGISNAQQPTVIFSEPLVFELTGAGFQKSAGNPYYELRWARITKWQGREMSDALSLSQLQTAARAAMKVSNMEAPSLNDWIWNNDPNVASAAEWNRVNRDKEIAEWKDKLEKGDRLGSGRNGGRSRSGWGIDRSASLSTLLDSLFGGGMRTNNLLGDILSTPALLWHVDQITSTLPEVKGKGKEKEKEKRVEVIDLTNESDDDPSSPIKPPSRPTLPLVSTDSISSSLAIFCTCHPTISSIFDSAVSSSSSSPSSASSLAPPSSPFTSTFSPLRRSSSSVSSSSLLAAPIIFNDHSPRKRARLIRRASAISNSSFDDSIRDRIDPPEPSPSPSPVRKRQAVGERAGGGAGAGGRREEVEIDRVAKSSLLDLMEQMRKSS